ncbi:MAG: IPT/TIG domain-containing protein, partial [Cytophagales bacterium]|nr:IPT/TIG domain-containing protein [Cytophagales bacterium]
IDVVKNEAFWIFQSIDPVTGLAPSDALKGFLPVNDTTINRFNDTIPKRGEGFVSFTIRPVSTVQTGDTVNARAKIVFDINEPILTNTWTNTVDAVAPASRIRSLSQPSATAVQLNWRGQDDPGGTGIRSYALYVSQNGDPFTARQTDLPDTTATFTGTPGFTYRFFVLATDHTGNQETLKSEAEASVTLTGNAPVIAGLTDQTTCQNTPTPPIAFTATDSTAEAGDLVFTATLSDTTLVPGGQVVFGGTGANRTLVLTPRPGKSGSATVTVRATNPEGVTGEASFNLTVKPAPVVNAGPDQTVSVTDPPFALAGYSPAGGTWSGSGVTADGTFTPAQAGKGSFPLVYTVQQDGCAGSDTLRITVVDGQVAVSIAGFTPAAGPAGTVVTITGAHFTGATAVRFNGVAATEFQVLSAAEIKATVPAGATTGPIQVATPADTATSATAFTVQSKAVPVVTWADPAPIIYGTPLSVLQLNATADVAGSFDYQPPADSVLNAGQYTLVVTFTPENQAAYEVVTQSVRLTVLKATPIVNWPPLAPVVQGTSLGDRQLNATANAPGTFAYTPGPGTVLPAGVHPVYLSFTPADPANYNKVAGIIRRLTVTEADLCAGGSCTLRINAGGGSYADQRGYLFMADTYVIGGRATQPVTGDVALTEDDELYRQGRFGTWFLYNLPTGNGLFDVVLHFAEPYWGNQVAGGVGSRRFSVKMEGITRLAEYDIYQRAGGTMRAVQEVHRVRVKDGVMSIRFDQGSANYAYVSALEVVPVGATARTANDNGGAGWKVVLYPDPVDNELTVLLDQPADAIESTEISNAAGGVHFRNRHKVVDENRLLIDVSSLKPGLYLLRLQTAQGHQVMKFVKR